MSRDTQMNLGSRPKLPERVEDVLLELSNHTDMPESDQAQYLNNSGGFRREESPKKNDVGEQSIFRPFPIEQTPYFVEGTECVLFNEVGNPATHAVRPRSGGRGTKKLFSETEYENADSDYPFSETESQLLSVSPQTRFLRSARLAVVPNWNLSPDKPAEPVTQDDSVIGVSPLAFRRQNHFLSSLEYLALDPGHDADIDSLASSRCSSRIFFDESAIYPFPQMRQNSAPVGIDEDSEYENSYRPGILSLHPQPVSDMEIDFFDEPEEAGKPEATSNGIQKLASDIKKSFGEFKLASFSDLGSSDD